MDAVAPDARARWRGCTSGGREERPYGRLLCGQPVRRIAGQRGLRCLFVVLRKSPSI